MLIELFDFNDAKALVKSKYSKQWVEIQETLKSLPLHLKASDQAGKQGDCIFDVVGTNEFIKKSLTAKAWSSNIPIPAEFSFLGTNIDFCKQGVIVEVQFSNYPFLLNNVIRSELFFKSKMPLVEIPTGLVIIITKARMFPASNSTLYFEQAANQLKALEKNKVFDASIRLVGLFEKPNSRVAVKWTQYHSPRYSRTVTSRVDRECEVFSGKSGRSRCTFHII